MQMSIKYPEKLSSSPAVASLRAERTIVKILQSLNWEVAHGSFFTDPTTQKPREVDISAERHWTKSSGRRQQYASVILKCEIKSVRDYHLVFAPRADREQSDSIQCIWMGYEDERLSAELEKAGLESEMINKLLIRFESIMSYPSGVIRPYRLLVDPLPAPVRSTAFRETNIGSEKDLETSVLWKATQSLNSAVQSDQNERLNNAFQDIRDDTQLAVRLRKNVYKVVSESITSKSNSISLYHPVIVTESKLWYLGGKVLVPIQWCRFCQVGIGSIDRWFDVVSIAHAKSYFHKLTHHYRSQMMRAGAKRDTY